MKVLISGITGFVGQNLTSYLREHTSYELNGLVRSKTEAEHLFDEGVKSLFSYAELTEKEEFDAYIHLAGKAHDTGKTSNSEEYFQVNTELTEQLFDMFLQSSARDFIFISSVKAVADTVDGVLDEDAIPDPKTFYGQSKLKAEEYVLSKELPAEKQIFILRPCMIHGPGNKGNLNLLHRFISKRIPWPLGSYDNSRSFLSIDNLC